MSFQVETVGSQTQTQQTVTSKPTLPPHVQEKFTAIVSDMLVKAHELAFELSTIECENAHNCAVCKKAREIVRLIKELVKLQREFSKM